MEVIDNAAKDNGTIKDTIDGPASSKPTLKATKGSSSKEIEKDPKEKKDGDDDDGGKCVVDPKMMKLITLITLLVSDADVIFTSERTTFLSQPIGHELV